MPLPIIEFTKDMTNIERASFLKKMQEYMASAEFSSEKKLILEDVIQYAYRYLVNLNSKFSKAEPDKIPLCCRIFSYADLPDLFFAKLVCNELETVQDQSHILKKTTLSRAKKYKDLLLVPKSSQIKNIAVGLMALSLSLQRLEVVVGLCYVYAYSDYLAELSLEKVLDNFLAKHFGQSLVPSVNNETSVLNRFSNARHYALQLFQRALVGDLSPQTLRSVSEIVARPKSN